MTGIAAIAARLGVSADALRFGDDAPAARARAFDEGRLRLAGRDPVWIESDAADPAWIGGPVRGTVAMSNFGQNGRLGNRLLQYAFLRLYGWRNGLDVAMPHWPEGEALALPPPAAAIRKGRWPVVTFGPFEDAAALELWRTADPPADVDFDGYFQEIPESWLAHRAAFRRLLRLRSDAETRIADWRAAAAPPGTTLVAIHVRRGDFADYDPSANPHFRMAPIAWYRDWLAQAWPTLRRPRLFVATDDRAAVLPAFADFARVDGPSTGLGGVFDDLAGMREADILALCNSSFSRSAALMAADGQRQMIVDFDAGRLVGYDAWADRGFWRRFGPVREFPAGEIDRRFAHALGEHRLRPWRRLARKVPVLGPAMLALRMRFRTGAV